MIKEKKLPDYVHERIPHLVRKLKSMEYVNALFFFGSIVHMELKPLSDIDMAVLLTGKAGNKDARGFDLELQGIVEDALSTTEFDLIIMNSAPLRFAYTILKDGQLVFVKNKEELISFRERVVKYYLDFAYYRKQLDKAFIEGIGYHG